MALDFMRQTDIVDRTKLNADLCIVGAGAIGSYTAVILCKMGYAGNICVYDDDYVQEHNIPNQFYMSTSADLHSNKVEALYRLCLDFSDKQIRAIHQRINAVPNGHEVVILTVDDMDTRIGLYKTLPQSVKWLFDGRMGAEIMRIYTVDITKPEDREFYEANLYSSADAEPLRCTARAIIYNVSIIAGLLVNQIKRALTNQSYSREIIFALPTLELIKS